MKKYSLVIASNFLDHYMLAMSLQLQKYFKDFCFVVSEKLSDEYSKLGFSDLNNNEIVFKAYEDKVKAKELILNADVVITGSYKYMNHIQERLKEDKIVFYFSERLFKNDNKLIKALQFVKYKYRHAKDKKSLLLCTSAYAGKDYNEFGLFIDRTYKWGYFPKTKLINDIDELIKEKEENSLLWAGRLIDWKHPDIAIEVARRLKEEGYSFKLRIIGNGQMKDILEKKISDNNLNDYVLLMGSMPPEKVRENMEKSMIYLFTSDIGEGWGVVLNEAMNSACATVASNSAGSTPFLIKDKENGMIYFDDDVENLYKNVKYLLDNQDKCKQICKNAYENIVYNWNNEVLANRFYQFVDKLVNKEDYQYLFKEGILSKDNGK